jgi:hypothetical protein
MIIVNPSQKALKDALTKSPFLQAFFNVQHSKFNQSLFASFFVPFLFANGRAQSLISLSPDVVSKGY